MNGMVEIGTDGAADGSDGTDDSTVAAYRSEPPVSVGAIRGALIVVHEVWGLVDHIKDVADRFAAEGYLVLAPDLLASLGPSPSEIDELRTAMQNPDPAARTAIQPRLREIMTPLSSPEFSAAALAQLRSCVDVLLAEPGVDSRVGIVGFCFGGTQSYSLAVHEPRLRAAVPFYGHADYPVAALAGIRCPIQAFYGENDARLMGQLPEFRERMREAGVDFRAEVFADCGHAFFNDTNPSSYNAQASAQAWRQTLAFLAEALSE